MEPVLLRMNDIAKSFDETQVHKGVCFCAAAGELHGIIGDNAAGKTTLVNLLAGSIQPDAGEIYFEDKKVKIRGRAASEAMGISVCGQDVELFSDLTIIENVIAGKESRLFHNKCFVPGLAQAGKLVSRILDELGVTADMWREVRTLSEGERMLVQIARTVIGGPKLIVLDEATSMLTDVEIQRVFAVLTRLKKEGSGVIVISHQIDKLLDNCDKVSLLRGGRIIGTYPAAEARALPIVQMMTGSAVDFKYPRLAVKKGEPVLVVENVSAGILQDISFTLHRGEILGLAGLVGSGRTTLVRAITGECKLTAGSIEVVHKRSHGMGNFGVVPDDYDRSSLFKKMSVGSNITMSNLNKAADGRIVYPKRERIYARDMADRVGIVSAAVGQDIDTQNAGNKKKAIIARAIFGKTDIFLFDEPTKDLSLVSALDTYNMFNALVQRGAAIILISSNFSELLGMCSRIIVLREGRQVAETKGEGISVEYLYSYVNG